MVQRIRDFCLILHSESKPNVVWIFGQQQLVFTEVVVGWKGTDAEKNKEKKLICLFENNVYVYVYYALLD